MQTHLLLIIAILFLFSCTNQNTIGEKHTVPDQDSLPINRNTVVDTVSPVKLNKGELPAEITFKGEFQHAYAWFDRLGENIIVFSKTNERRVKNNENENEKESFLYASRFLKSANGWQATWAWNDGVMACPFDITCEFLKDAITITDLDEDGVAETCFQANLTCRSDVSPSQKKLILVEDDKAYSLVGSMWLPQGPEHEMDITEKNVNLENEPKPKEEWEQFSQLAGRYENEKTFKSAPPQFLRFARAQWLKHVKESFD